MDNYMNLFYVFVAVMLVFGGLLAFTVLFATMSVNVAERGLKSPRCAPPASPAGDCLASSPPKICS
jgi:hypothetical protein